MPISLSYPGVYIQEVPSGVRTVTGVATSITAFIGRAMRGPVNEPVTINSFADFERNFGGLWNESYLGFAVRDFYLNGGSQAIIVRVQNNGAKASLPSSQTLNTLTLTAADTGTSGNSIEVAVGHYSAGDVNAEAKAKAYGLNLSDLFSLTITGPSETPNKIDYLTIKDPATAVTPSPRVDLMLESQTQPIVYVTQPLPNVVPDVKTSTALTGGSDDPEAKAQIILTSSAVITDLPVTAASEGSWGNNLQVTISQNNPNDPVANAIAQQYKMAVSDFFNLTVVDTLTNTTEQYNNLTVINSPRRVDQILSNQSNLVRITAGSTLPNIAPTAITAKSFTGGKDGDPLDATSVVGEQNAKSGLYALEKAALFNLLCIPPYANGPNADNTGGTDIDDQVLTEAAAYCKQRRAFFIIDAPSAWNDVDAAVNQVTDLPIRGDAAAYAGVYFPRLQYPNPLSNNQLQTFVPCGMVAGTIARTDSQRGIWKAPAGLEAALNGMTKFTIPLTDAEIGLLNPLGINCLRNAPAAGPVIWGARTRLGDDRLASDWKYIPVRRLASYIEESLYRDTQWVVFEPNDEPLWSQIRLNIGSFMNQLFRQGAFQGLTTQEAYFVKCDSDTTTQADINNGVVNILVGFAPLKPAEFVVISIQQMAGNIQA